ncbi:MAG: hypothetical protein JWP82_902 [Humibacillus sp.]|nr:hypothetical protein [Humibacillus sp.]
MSRTIEREYHLRLSPARLLELLRLPDFTQARLEAARRQEPVLLGHSATANRVRLSAQYYTRRDELPGWMASRFPEHGPQNTRAEDWTVSGDQLSATFTITAEGNATEVEGTYTVVEAPAPASAAGGEADGPGSVWRVRATATARIPVLGRRIEAVVLEGLDRAFALEAQEMSAQVVRNA